MDWFDTAEIVCNFWQDVSTVSVQCIVPTLLVSEVVVSVGPEFLTTFVSLVMQIFRSSKIALAHDSG